NTSKGTKTVKGIPPGFHAITPRLLVKGASQAIEFYKKAFGAQEIYRSTMPDGTIMHATLKIGDSHFYVNDEMGGFKSPLGLGGSPVSIDLYVEDADAVFTRAVAAGAKVQMPIADQFWGDRFGSVIDPYGHVWSVSTRKEEVSPEELEKRAKAAFSQPVQKQ